jgi:large subunit ribosomal protein LX
LSQVKKFRITGVLRKGGDKLPFKKEISALKKEDAIQHLYTDMGSRHKARRFEISIQNVEELTSNPEAVE